MILVRFLFLFECFALFIYIPLGKHTWFDNHLFDLWLSLTLKSIVFLFLLWLLFFLNSLLSSTVEVIYQLLVLTVLLNNFRLKNPFRHSCQSFLSLNSVKIISIVSRFSILLKRFSFILFLFDSIPFVLLCNRFLWF